MRGGFLDSLTSSFSSWGSSLSNPFKKKSTSYTPTTPTPTPTTPTPTTYTPTTYTPTTYTPSGGKRRKRASRRKYRGGFTANKSLNDVASGASSINVKTAQPQAWVGGKTRKHKHRRSCKH